MPSPTTSMGIVLTDTALLADAQAPLGFEYVQPADETGVGDKVWIYVFNDEAAAAFAAGTIVARDATTTTYDGIVAPLSSPTIRLLGVAQHAIAAGYCGFILKRGIGEVLADTGGITANTALVVGNAVTGRADDVTAVTDHAFAFSTEAATATNLATCYINCPG